MKLKIRNKKFVILFVIFIVTLLISFYSPVYAKDMSKVDAKGAELLKMMRKLGYWIIIFLGLKDIIREALKGDFRSTGQVIIRYILIYGSMFFLPWALKFVEDIF